MLQPLLCSRGVGRAGKRSMPPGEEVLLDVSNEMGEARHGEKTKNVCVLHETLFIGEDKRIGKSNSLREWLWTLAS